MHTLQEARPALCTPAQSPDRSIPSLPSGAWALLLQAPTLPSSSSSPAFTTSASGLTGTEYFRTSTHPERELFENFVCVSRALSTSWAGPGHPGGRLRVSGISQHTGGKPPRKSHLLDPLLQPCDTALRLPIPVPRSNPGRGRTTRKPSAAGAFLHDQQPNGVRREREVAGESSGSSYPFKGRLAEGSFFLPHPRNRGAPRRSTVASGRL